MEDNSRFLLSHSSFIPCVIKCLVVAMNTRRYWYLVHTKRAVDVSLCTCQQHPILNPIRLGPYGLYGWAQFLLSRRIGVDESGVDELESTNQELTNLGARQICNRPETIIPNFIPIKRVSDSAFSTNYSKIIYLLFQWNGNIMRKKMKKQLIMLLSLYIL